MPRASLTVLVLAVLLLATPAAADARGPNLPCAATGVGRYILKFRPGARTHFGPGGSFGGG